MTYGWLSLTPSLCSVSISFRSIGVAKLGDKSLTTVVSKVGGYKECEIEVLEPAADGVGSCNALALVLVALRTLKLLERVNSVSSYIFAKIHAPERQRFVLKAGRNGCIRAHLSVETFELSLMFPCRSTSRERDWDWASP